MRIIKDRSQIVLVVVGMILLASNIFLILMNIQLKKKVEESKLFVTEEGYHFSNLKLNGLDGHQEIVDFSDKQLETLLFVFSPSCNYCVQQYPSWKELAGSIDYSRWRILAVTSEDNYDKIRTHIEEHKLSNIKVGSMSKEDMRRARMLFTPMTLIVDKNGDVKKVWPGLWKKGFDLSE
jgi:hypothetical protein